MNTWLLAIGLLIANTAIAGLPPTSSRISGDAANVTTFNFQFPNFTGTHSPGGILSLGVNSIAGGGTNSSTALNNNRVIISSGGKLVEQAALTANSAVITDASGLPIASGVSSTTLAYLDATSSVQTQLNGKQPTGNYITALTGDVSASGPGSVSATVNNVGGSTAANVHAAELAANAATNLNTASTIVKRDGAGNFSAGTITAALTGNVTGNVTGNLTGSVTGNASTATALAANPADCGANQFANAIAASGDLTCAQPAFTNVSGTVAVNQGGTGQTSYTNGQLLIGNTTGNTLVRSTLTPGAGITITNGAGSITIAASGTPAASLVTKSSNYTVTATDNVILVDATNGPVTITLIAAATLGSGGSHKIKKIDTTSNLVTIARAGSDTIEGSTSLVLSDPYASAELISNGGTAYYVF